MHVACAGRANASVRDACGLGVAERRLLADVRPHDTARLNHLPDAARFCDPARPQPIVATTPATGLLLSPASSADFDDPRRTGELLAPLIGKAVCEHRPPLAESTREGRGLVRGGPPRTAEGM